MKGEPTQARQAAGTEATLKRAPSVAAEIDPQGEVLPSVVKAVELGELEVEDISSGPDSASSLLLFEIACWKVFDELIVGEYQLRGDFVESEYRVYRGGECRDGGKE